jgi:penicillin-binding protein 2
MVSEPAYDANKFAQGISKDDYSALINDPDNPLFSRSISANVASGSVFKPVVGAAAMAEHTINENTSVLSTGGIHVGKSFFPDWKAGGHGVTNLAKGIAESVNTFFYSIGGGTDSITGLGVERIVNYAKKFGYGSPLGIDLPNEGAGFLPTKEWKQNTKGERWYIGDTYHVAIGQGDVIVTPLQVAMMTTVFANHGTLYRPRVVQAMTASDGTRVEKDPEVITPQVTDKFAIDAVRRGMRQTVTAGSARSLNALPVQVAGKTGTAQWNSKKSNHAWFTSFAPYDKPTITVTVLVEEGVEGSVNASPVAREIYRWYFGGRKDVGAMPAVVKPSAEPAVPPAAVTGTGTRVPAVLAQPTAPATSPVVP